jgi:hypothetical protein
MGNAPLLEGRVLPVREYVNRRLHHRSASGPRERVDCGGGSGPRIQARAGSRGAGCTDGARGRPVEERFALATKTTNRRGRCIEQNSAPVWLLGWASLSPMPARR